MTLYGRQIAVGDVVGATAKTVNLEGMAAPICVHLLPEASNDMKVEVSITPRAAADPASANWIDESTTTASAKKRVVITGPCSAVRISRTSGSGTANKYEVRA